MAKKRDVITGKFKFVKNKDKKNKDINVKEFNEKKLRKKNKKLRKRCECNHIDSVKNKRRLEEIYVGGDKNDGGAKYYRCKICGGKIIADDNLLKPAIVKQAVDTIYSAFSRVRLKYALKDSVDRDITTALYTNARLIDIIDTITSEDMEVKKDKKKKKKKKYNKYKYSRVNY